MFCSEEGTAESFAHVRPGRPGKVIAEYTLKTVKTATPSVCSMLGAELKKARKAAGLTQEQLAFKAEIHRTYVSMLERGKGSPTVETLLRICKVLNVRASTLIRRIEKESE